MPAIPKVYFIDSATPCFSEYDYFALPKKDKRHFIRQMRLKRERRQRAGRFGFTILCAQTALPRPAQTHTSLLTPARPPAPLLKRSSGILSHSSRPRWHTTYYC